MTKQPIDDSGSASQKPRSDQHRAERDEQDAKREEQGAKRDENGTKGDEQGTERDEQGAGRDAQSVRAAALRAACEAATARSREGDRRFDLRFPRKDTRTSPNTSRSTWPNTSSERWPKTSSERSHKASSERSPELPEMSSRRPIELAMRHELFEAARLLYAIVETGDCLRAAHSFSGEPALCLDRRSELLAAIDKCGGCPTFSDLGRALRVTRQAARAMALAAERAGDVELFVDPDDRRAFQVALTVPGRRKLDRRRLPPSGWTFTLLEGVLAESMRTTADVVGVIRERLRRYDQELR
jgi:DNA-binding MarR family transcriptional regulator